jgi:hypothetical protein
MGDAHYPGKELSFFIVYPIFKGFNDFNKSLLEDVFCDVTIENFRKNKVIDSGLVLVNEYF